MQRIAENSGQAPSLGRGSCTLVMETYCEVSQNRKKHENLKNRELFYVCVYVCMVITYSKGKDQPGKVVNPARGQLNR